MSAKVSIHEAKCQFFALVARAEAGEEILIARSNKPVVRLVQVEPEQVQRQLGEAKGLVRMAPDFDEPPEGLMGHFR